MSENANLYARFERRFPKDRDTALLHLDDGRVLSYATVEKASCRIANSLACLGVGPGDRVTVQVEKSPENLFLYLACLRAGFVYHPLNTAYTASELGYFLADAAPTVVVCAPDKLGAIQRALAAMSDVTPPRAVLTLDGEGGGSLMQAAADAADDSPVALCSGDDMAALLYSSGTTGQPKGIVLTHDNLRKNVETLVDIWGFTPGDRLLHALPIYHVHGLFVAVGCVLMSGASLHWQNGFAVTAVVSALPECTVMMGVPTYYTRLLREPAFGRPCCATMRLFISGSAPLLVETFTAFEERTGHRILERYGMTETGMNTSNPLHGERRAGTVGLPLPGVDVRIVDDAGNGLAVNETGNLQVKGPNVFPGYWNLPEKTVEAFTQDGFFDTGDQGFVDELGYISLVGRAKDMIISGGLNVYPKEIEGVIDELPGVAESAVIGVPHADFGEAVLAVVVPRDEAPTAAQIMAHCRERLANFKLPKEIRTVEALPRNAMGKVQKNLLREQFAKSERGPLDRAPTAPPKG